MATPVLKRLQHVLAHYDLEPLPNIEICSTSGINEVFFITTEQGKIALKHHIQNNSRTRLLQEIEFAEQLTQSGIPCPKVLINQSGKNLTEYRSSELYSVSEYVEGNYFPKKSSLKKHHIENAASSLAKFHQVSKEHGTFLISKQLPSYDLSGLTNRLMTYRCELRTLEQNNHCAAALLSLIHHAMPIAMGLPKLLPEELLSGCEKVIIHGDFQASNVLVDEKGQIKAFLDLDDARDDLRIYDLFRLAWYCVEQEYSESREQSWQECVQHIFESYNQVNPLNPAELKAFPALAHIHFLHSLADERLDVTEPQAEQTVVKLQQAMRSLNDDYETLTRVCEELA